MAKEKMKTYALGKAYVSVVSKPEPKSQYTWICIDGTLLDGFEFFGPFKTRAAAEKFWEASISDSGCIVLVVSPVGAMVKTYAAHVKLSKKKT